MIPPNRLKKSFYKSILHLFSKEYPKKPYSTIPKRIALWQFGGLGDILLITPILQSIDKMSPHSSVTVFCTHPERFEFLKRFKCVEQLVRFPVYDLDMGLMIQSKFWKTLYRSIRDMRKGKYDLLINYHNPWLIDWYFWQTLIAIFGKVKFRAGFHPPYIGNRYFYHAERPWPSPNQHLTQCYLELTEASGIPIYKQKTHFPITENDLDEVKKNIHFNIDSPYIVLHPGGLAPSQWWPLENYRTLAMRLTSLDCKVVVIGWKSESNRLHTICHDINNCVPFCGEYSTSILAALIAHAHAFIGNDSGPFHIAAAVGTYSIGLFGSDGPRYSAYDQPHVQIIRSDVSCSPCYQHDCPNPPETQMICMKNISVDQILEAVQSIRKEGKNIKVSSTS